MIKKLKPFINKYKCEGRNVLPEKQDWKKFEKSNVTISLNVLYAKKKKIYPACVSKHNRNREKQVIFLMIPHGKTWLYLPAKKLSALLRRVTPKHNGIFLSHLSSFFCNKKQT